MFIFEDFFLRQSLVYMYFFFKIIFGAELIEFFNSTSLGNWKGTVKLDGMVAGYLKSVEHLMVRSFMNILHNLSLNR